MVTQTSTSGRSQPLRLPWWDRWSLHGAARRDAFRGRPALDVFQGPVTTAQRVRVMVARDADLGDLRRRRVHNLAPTVRELERLTGILQTLHANRSKARANLTSVTDALPATPSTGHASERVTRSRNDRSLRAVVAGARAREEAAHQALTTAEGEISRLRALCSAAEAEYRAEVMYLGALAELRRATYDRALVRHHPHGDLLDAVLDRSVPGLPDAINAPLHPDGTRDDSDTPPA